LLGSTRRQFWGSLCYIRVVFVIALLGLTSLGGLAADVQPLRSPETSATNGGRGLAHPKWRAPQACIDCHAFSKEFSHPVGVIPSFGLPTGLPLEQGRVTCTTCHEDPGRSSGEAPYLRARLQGGDACAPCHGSQGASKAGPHSRAGLPAHLPSEAFNSRPIKRASNSGLDDASRTCLACHDGAVAVEAGAHLVASARGLDQTRDHPVGVRYQSRSGRESEIELHPVVRLDRRVRLFEGTVGCGSCHSVYSNVSDHLVIANDQSRLCLTCHVE
jgi:predicted CXXCH cytochrome family protein